MTTETTGICGATEEMTTWIGPLFKTSRADVFRCAREPGHGGEYHTGPSIDGAARGWATWPAESPEGGEKGGDAR